MTVGSHQLHSLVHSDNVFQSSHSFVELFRDSVEVRHLFEILCLNRLAIDRILNENLNHSLSLN